MVTCETVDDAHAHILQVSQCSTLIKAIMIIKTDVNKRTKTTAKSKNFHYMYIVKYNYVV